MKRFAVGLALLLMLCALAWSDARAQSKSVVVERRDGEMILRADGTVQVVETWVVNFQGGPFRFAFRAIPLKRISSLQFQGVSENGNAYTRAHDERPNTYRVDMDGNRRVLYWYFEPTTNATRVFELRYTLYDALRIYDGGDQFWWKFIEAERGYPIEASRVTVRLPAEFPPAEILATTYENGDETGGAQVLNGGVVEFTGGPFADDVEWEIRAQFPHGAVTQAAQPWQKTDDAIHAQQELAAQRMERFSFFAWLTTWIVLIGGSLGLLGLWFVGGRDAAIALPAEFLNAPPSASPGTGTVLTPALAGTLIDEEANVRDVLATLIDWAQRGIITIRALPQGAKTADPNDDYTFEKINDAPPLAHIYERELMQNLFKGETRRSMLSIRHGFTASLDSMFDSLYNELRADGYWNARPDRVRGQYRRFAWLLLVLVCPVAFLFQILASVLVGKELFFSMAALAPWFALGAILMALLYLSRYLPRKTRAGAEATAQWNAFRRYLENIEKYTNVAAAQDQFEKYLPYAVAFGIDKTWVEKFAAVETPAPTWYIASATGRAPSATRSPSRPSSADSSLVSSGAGTVSGGGGGPVSSASAPSLDGAARGAFTSLNSVSASFFSMLNTTALTFTQTSSSAAPSSGSFRSSGSQSSWGSSSRSSGSSFSGGGSRGGGGGGGGSSGFG
jgi:uncharacterized membrane protein YgcG